MPAKAFRRLTHSLLWGATANSTRIPKTATTTASATFRRRLLDSEADNSFTRTPAELISVGGINDRSSNIGRPGGSIVAYFERVKVSGSGSECSASGSMDSRRGKTSLSCGRYKEMGNGGRGGGKGSDSGS